MFKKLSWYQNRLSLMTLPEIVYRAGKSFEKKTALLAKPEVQSVPEIQRVADGWFFGPEDKEAFRKILSARYGWKPDIAEQLKKHLFTFFAFEKKDFGAVIDWHRDYKSGKRAPVRYSKTIDYRDFEAIGDIKYIWEPSRHLHLISLAKAWFLTGEESYKTETIRQLESWIKENPFMMGVHWESSLEAGIRLISWSWVWFFLGEVNEEFRKVWLKSVYEHCVFISKNFSHYSSANNHLIGEASGLFIASTIWNFGEDSDRWKKKSFSILLKEIETQTYPDGVNKEQAVSYQQFVLDFFMLAAMIGEKNGSPFPQSYWQKIEAMLVYLASLMDAGGNIPGIGDADDGYAVRLSDAPGFDPYRSLLNSGVLLFGRGDFKSKAAGMDEKNFWLFGPSGEERYNLLEKREFKTVKAFPDAGYYILSSNEGTSQEIKVVTDCGPLGYLSLAAHGHSDALSFTLSVGGVPVLVDPGTYAYHAQKVWRDYFKSTAAHNTVTVDGLDQSVSGGNFMWLKKAAAEVLKWESNPQYDFFSGRHDGYFRLSDPVLHQRSLLLDKQKQTLKITDKISMRAEHKLQQFFHAAPGFQIKKISAEPIWEISGRGIQVLIKLDSAGESAAFCGQEAPPLGWFSKQFDVKEPSPVLVNTLTSKASIEMQTIITIANHF